MWFVTLVSIIGSILNAKKSKWCFYIWITANLIWLTYDIHIRLYSRAALDVVQTIICISGIIHWAKEDKRDESNSRGL